MAKKRWRSDRQRKAFFAQLNLEQAGRKGPTRNPAVDFLLSGPSKDKRIKELKEKLDRQEQQRLVHKRRGKSFDPGKGKGSGRSGGLPGRLVSGVYGRYDAGGEESPEISAYITVGGRRLPLPKSGEFEGKQKAELSRRAKAYFERREQRAVFSKVARKAEDISKRKMSAFDRMLARRAGLLPGDESEPLSKSDKALLSATLERFRPEGGRKTKWGRAIGAFRADEKYDITPIEKLYGTKGYHVVPRLELYTQGDTRKFETAERVVYPVKSLQAFRNEGSQTFPQFKKSASGEWISTNILNPGRDRSPKFKDGKLEEQESPVHLPRIEGPERLGPKAPARMSVLKAKPYDNRKLQHFKPTGYYEKREASSLIPYTTISGWKKGSPYQEIVGRTRTADPSTRGWARTVDGRWEPKEGATFIVDAEGRPLLPPKLRKIEVKKYDKFGTWKPDDLVEHLKWQSLDSRRNDLMSKKQTLDSVAFTKELQEIDDAKEKIFNNFMKRAAQNPLRGMLEEAELQTEIQREKRILSKTMAGRIANIAEAAKTIHMPSDNIRVEARRRFVLEKLKEMKDIRATRDAEREKFDRILRRAQNKVATRYEKLPRWKRVLKKFTRGFDTPLAAVGGVATITKSKHKASSLRGSPKQLRPTTQSDSIYTRRGRGFPHNRRLI